MSCVENILHPASDSSINPMLAANRLLLVEDDPTQRLLLERRLRRAGYAVETAKDGGQALAMIANTPFRYLVTDWDMPGLDGASLCRRVRESRLPHYLYILLLTGHSSTDDLVAGLEAGADDYIRKPAEPAELLARLKAGGRIIELEHSLREAHAQVERLSITDALVGTYNRRYLNEQLAREVARARRSALTMSVVIADLDHFKRINDAHGHQVGDEVLKHFAELARQAIRASDWIARFGGEEFVVVLPETDLEGAAALAEKIRSAWALQPISTSAGALSVTASFGAASLLPRQHARESGEAVDFADALLKSADAALYRSKREGRNRVTTICL